MMRFSLSRLNGVRQLLRCKSTTNVASAASIHHQLMSRLMDATSTPSELARLRTEADRAMQSLVELEAYDLCMTLFFTIGTSRLQLNSQDYAMAIHAALQTGNIQQAKTLYASYIDDGLAFKPRINLDMITIPDYNFEQKFQFAEPFFKMPNIPAEQRKKVVNTITKELCDAAALEPDSKFVQSKFKEVTRFIPVVKNLPPEVFASLFNAVVKVKGFDQAMNLFTKYSLRVTSVDPVIVTSVVQACSKYSDSEKARSFVSSLIKDTTQLKFLQDGLYVETIELFCRNGAFVEAVVLCKYMKSIQRPETQEAFDLLLRYCERQSQRINLIKYAKTNFDLIPSVAVLQMFLEYCEDFASVKFLVSISKDQPRNSKFYDQYLAAIKKHCENNAEKATLSLEVLSEMLKENVSPSFFAFQTALDMCESSAHLEQLLKIALDAPSLSFQKSLLVEPFLDAFSKHCSSEDTITAFKILVEAGFSPDWSGFRKLVGLLSSVQLRDQLPQFVRDMKKSGLLQPKDQYLLTLWGLSASQNPSKAPAMLDRLSIQ